MLMSNFFFWIWISWSFNKTSMFHKRNWKTRIPPEDKEKTTTTHNLTDNKKKKKRTESQYNTPILLRTPVYPWNRYPINRRKFYYVYKYIYELKTSCFQVDRSVKEKKCLRSSKRINVLTYDLQNLHRIASSLVISYWLYNKKEAE